MGIICKKCNKGKMLFSDGGLKHEPSWECSNCGYETKELEETKWVLT